MKMSLVDTGVFSNSHPCKFLGNFCPCEKYIVPRNIFLKFCNVLLVLKISIHCMKQLAHDISFRDLIAFVKLCKLVFVKKVKKTEFLKNIDATVRCVLNNEKWWNMSLYISQGISGVIKIFPCPWKFEYPPFLPINGDTILLSSWFKKVV